MSDASAQPLLTDYDYVVSLVRSRFQVREHYLREDGSVEFRLLASSSDKDNFAHLSKELRSKGFLAFLRKLNEEIVLAVGRATITPHHHVRLAGVLFVATVGTVFLDGLLQSSGPRFGGFSPFQMAVFYVLALMGILGIHELGHKVVASRQGMRSSLPYFIPGIPGLGLPTFGAVIVTGEPSVNRDRLFDLALAGPLAGMLVTLVVSLGGAATSILIPESEAQTLIGQSQLIPLQPSLLMSLIFSAFGKLQPGMVAILSPIAYAAWLGFLIHFLNLLPAWQLDGGHMARAVLGRGKHRITTFASAFVLVILGYWVMALFILVFSLRALELRPLDDVSPLSKGRKLVFLGGVVLAILSAPIPF